MKKRRYNFEIMQKCLIVLLFNLNKKNCTICTFTLPTQKNFNEFDTIKSQIFLLNKNT